MLYVIGLNYHHSAITIRERYAPGSQSEALCQVISRMPSVDEVFVLSTCNRCEIYCLLKPSFNSHLPDPDAPTDPLLDSLREHITQEWQGLLGIQPSDAKQVALFSLWGRGALEHISRVASGLEAMILGEPQILGQLKAAIRDANTYGTAGAGMKRLLNPVFELVKQVRTETKVGCSPVSFASATFQLAQQIFSDVESCELLFVGAGEMIELVCRQFYHQQAQKIRVANRTLQRIAPLVSDFGVEAYGLDDIPELIQKSDIIISCTGSHETIISKKLAESSLTARKNKPLFLADLAVPRDICPSISNLENAFLYTVDDIHRLLQGSKDKRLVAAEEAYRVIKAGVDDILAQQRVHYFSPVIQQYRQDADAIRVEALAQARRQLIKGEDPFEVLETMSQNLTKKLIHKPTKGLRSIASQGGTTPVAVIKELLGLDER